MPRPTADLTGQRFGRLVVLARDPGSPTGHAQWHCRCDCGTSKSVTSNALRSGFTQSCGCLRRQNTTARNTTHGGSHTPTYYSWSNMIRRTSHKNDPRYAGWGGRGITVCDAWREYPAFLADMGEKPPGTTLDRIDNGRGYEPGNCRWATPAEQARNTRTFKLTVQKVLEIQQLHDQGLAVGVIAEAVGMRRHTVGTVCTVLQAITEGGMGLTTAVPGPGLPSSRL